MIEWKPIDIRDFQKPQSRDIGGVATDVVPSPFDIPTAVRSECDADGEGFAIFFRYLNEPEEPALTEPLASDLVVRLGKETGRVLGIQVRCPDEDTAATDAVADMRAALDRLAEVGRTQRSGGKTGFGQPRPENLRIAREVLGTLSDKGDLFSRVR